MDTPCTFTPKVGVYDVSPFTMLDYPGQLACLVWFGGCNLRCVYCHNPKMVKSVGETPWAKVEGFLASRKGKLNAVVLTGGEATLHPDLVEIAARIKAMGYKVKLDTNGTRPTVVRELLARNLLDFVALDYKAVKTSFTRVTQVKESLYDAFAETLDMLICQTAVPFEVRTTVHSDILSEADVEAIRTDLATRGYTGPYYVQNFRPCEDTLGHLPLQTAPLNTGLLAANLPTGAVKVAFRNF